jgi:hypothetical protein
MQSGWHSPEHSNAHDCIQLQVPGIWVNKRHQLQVSVQYHYACMRANVAHGDSGMQKHTETFSERLNAAAL